MFERYYLVADIGGTNANFAIINQKDFSIALKSDYKTAENPDFYRTLKKFLETAKKYSIKEACFAIAGPISNDRTTAQLMNANWKKKDRKSTRLNSSHVSESRMPSSA